jgi:hypothetical protein
MSISFRPLTPIRMADLFDGRLEDVGVYEHHHKEATSHYRCLTRWGELPVGLLQ